MDNRPTCRCEEAEKGRRCLNWEFESNAKEAREELHNCCHPTMCCGERARYRHSDGKWFCSVHVPAGALG